MQIFKTKRLNIRILHQDDMESFITLQTDEKVMRYVGGPMTRDEATANLAQCISAYTKKSNGFWIWAVTFRHDQHFIGTCAAVFSPGTATEIGFRLLPETWSRGLGAELVEALIGHVRKWKGDIPIQAFVNENNTASWKILEKFMILKGKHPNSKEFCVDRHYYLE